MDVNLGVRVIGKSMREYHGFGENVCWSCGKRTLFRVPTENPADVALTVPFKSNLPASTLLLVRFAAFYCRNVVYTFSIHRLSQR